MSTRIGGTNISCPGCYQGFTAEYWRYEDGPCADGQYYCVACIGEDKCPCKLSWLDKIRYWLFHPGGGLRR